MIKELKQLDNLVSKGKIEDAFEKFFHTDVVTWSGKKDKTKSKEEKLALLKGFMGNVETMNSCKLHGSLVDGSTSYSKFTFIFTLKSSEKLKWHEIIQRKWKKGLVIDEFYYHEDFKELKKRLEKKKAKLKKDEGKAKSNKKTKAKKKKSNDKKTKDINGFELLIADQSPIDNSKTPATPTAIVKEGLGVKKVVAKATTIKKRTTSPGIAKEVVGVKKLVDKAAKVKKSTTQPEIVKEDVSVKKEKANVATVGKSTTSPSRKSPKPQQAEAKETANTNKAVTTSITQPRDVKPKLSVPSVKTPDLTIIEGIGPKIKELLGLDGIITFEQVAKSKVEDLKNIMLTRGGTRYNANNPATWPEQAALAAAGKWEELKALKAELKFGKRV